MFFRSLYAICDVTDTYQRKVNISKRVILSLDSKFVSTGMLFWSKKYNAQDLWTSHHKVGTITEVSLRYIMWHHLYLLHRARFSTHPIYLLGRWRLGLSLVCNNQKHLTSLKAFDVI